MLNFRRNLIADPAQSTLAKIQMPTTGGQNNFSPEQIAALQAQMRGIQRPERSVGAQPQGPQPAGQFNQQNPFSQAGQQNGQPFITPEQTAQIRQYLASKYGDAYRQLLAQGQGGGQVF